MANHDILIGSIAAGIAMSITFLTRFALFFGGGSRDRNDPIGPFAFLSMVTKEGDPRVKLFDNFGASVQALIGGDVDMVLVDAASGRGYIGANPDKLKIVGDPLGSEDFGFSLPVSGTEVGVDFLRWILFCEPVSSLLRALASGPDPLS